MTKKATQYRALHLAPSCTLVVVRYDTMLSQISFYKECVVITVLRVDDIAQNLASTSIVEKQLLLLEGWKLFPYRGNIKGRRHGWLM